MKRKSAVKKKFLGLVEVLPPKFWVVWRVGNALPWSEHKSLAAARGEAARSALTEKFAFVILESIAEVRPLTKLEWRKL